MFTEVALLHIALCFNNQKIMSEFVLAIRYDNSSRSLQLLVAFWQNGEHDSADTSWQEL
jgi:hypothetical protein